MYYDIDIAADIARESIDPTALDYICERLEGQVYDEDEFGNPFLVSRGLAEFFKAAVGIGIQIERAKK